MVEVRDQALRRLGIEWQHSVPLNWQGELKGGDLNASIGTAEAVPITLHTLEARGLARTLANPKLTCRYETPCTFQAGGEIPIPLVGERYAQVIFKDYGIQLHLTAHHPAEDQLVIEIATEFSDVNQATAVNGIPGFVKNTLKTTAATRFHQSVVLSGLVNFHQSKNVTRTPLLGAIPLVGELFKSRDFERGGSEFILFLTPTPMVAADAVSRDWIQRSREKFEAAGQRMGAALGD
jgi:pilus assembly protein CpaC